MKHAAKRRNKNVNNFNKFAVLSPEPGQAGFAVQ